jgi:hypothetical protein
VLLLATWFILGYREYDTPEVWYFSGTCTQRLTVNQIVAVIEANPRPSLNYDRCCLMNTLFYRSSSRNSAMD